MRTVTVDNSIYIGAGHPLVLIAGPCVIETEDTTFDIARQLCDLCEKLSMPLIFKASFDKANRSSINSYRGPGLEKGLEILHAVKQKFGVSVLTDIHCVTQVEPVAQVVDILQIPAFLCRQTDLLVAAASCGKPINVKKGQFLAPWDVKNIVEKCIRIAPDSVTITERGVSFGYNNLVSDMRSLPIIRRMGVPVIFDATHSVQLPGGQATSSGGQREFIPHLARSAVAAGCDGVFFECHPCPESALCDGPNALPLDRMENLLRQLLAIDAIVKPELNREL
ncbi:MAG: 3-deoxy-8-phosphooctulonate synthase [Candidatus Auribacterota bacterium]|nr:3-deoxy-8-phosphooctulonate synthase [Candidatus Auribacterota bacterium]